MARNNSNRRSQSTETASQHQGTARNGARRSQGQRTSDNQRRSSSRQTSSSSSAGLNSLGMRAIETVRDHPVPAALIGAGVAWLLLETKQVRNLEGRVGDALSEYAGTARDALSGVAGYLGESISSVTEGGAHAGEYARETISDTFERHPLAVCAAVLAAGVAAGMMLPSTSTENSLLGRTSDALTKTIRTKGSEWMKQGRNLASNAAETVAGAVGLSTGNTRSSKRSRGGSSSGSRRKSTRRRSSARAD